LYPHKKFSWKSDKTVDNVTIFLYVTSCSWWIHSSENLPCTYQTTRPHAQGGCNIDIHYCENFISTHLKILLWPPTQNFDWNGSCFTHKRQQKCLQSFGLDAETTLGCILWSRTGRCVLHLFSSV